MRNTLFAACAALLMTCTFSCATVDNSQEPVKGRAPALKEQEIPAPAPKFKMAVLYFDNNSLTDQAEMDTIKKAVADLLTVAISRNRNILLVERIKLEETLRQHRMALSGVEGAGATEVGRMLGADYLLLGSYTMLAGELTVNARVVKVETGEVITGAQKFGASSELLGTLQSLAEEVNASLKAGGAAEKGFGEIPLEAVKRYSEALEAEDTGDRTAALSIYRELLKAYPGLYFLKDRINAAEPEKGAEK